MYQWEKLSTERRELYEAFIKFRESHAEPTLDDAAILLGVPNDRAGIIMEKYDWSNRRKLFRERLAAWSEEFVKNNSNGAALEANRIEELIGLINKRLAGGLEALSEIKIEDLIKLATAYIKLLSDFGKVKPFLSEKADFGDEKNGDCLKFDNPEDARAASELLERLTGFGV